MAGVVVRVRQQLDNPSRMRMVRYAAVSAICVPLSFLLVFLVYGVLRVWTEVPSTLFANVVSGIPNYYLNRRWVWGKTGRSHLTREVIPFWTIAAVGLTLSLLTAAWARHVGLEHHFGHELRTGLLLATNVGTFGVLWVVKYMLFHRMFRVEPAPERAPDLAHPA